MFTSVDGYVIQRHVRMSRVRRRQLLLLTVFAAIFWLIVSFFLFMSLPGNFIDTYRQKLSSLGVVSAATNSNPHPLLIKLLREVAKQRQSPTTVNNINESEVLKQTFSGNDTHQDPHSTLKPSPLTFVNHNEQNAIKSTNENVEFKFRRSIANTPHVADDLHEVADPADHGNFYAKEKNADTILSSTSPPAVEVLIATAVNTFETKQSRTARSKVLLDNNVSDNAQESSELNNPISSTYDSSIKDNHLSILSSPPSSGKFPIAPGPVKIKDIDLRQFPFELNDPGENGEPVETTMDQQSMVAAGWEASAFNQYVSDKISLERSLPDVRGDVCRYKTYDYSHLPRVCVIICFIEEAWSTLLRSVHSVLNRTPPELLDQILLVDDFSQRTHLQRRLDQYLADNFPPSKVKLIRLTSRQGLIRARLAAVNQTDADVIVFLDSHVECNVGWLEPLLETIVKDRRTVATPVIDVIDSNTFQYIKTPNDMRGSFNWNMQFVWSPVPEHEAERRRRSGDDPMMEPIRTPTIAGGLLAVDRRFFVETGGYDPGLYIWGGEHLELSFKTWMCGGQLLIVPCSRVGHVFRSSTPYKIPGPAGSEVVILERNNARVAAVWMDEYGELYLRRHPHVNQFLNATKSSLDERKELRKQLNCNSFLWYLHAINPELYRPNMRPKAQGQIRHHGTGLCLDVSQLGALSPSICDSQSGTQYFQLTRKGKLETGYEVCVTVTGNEVHTAKCGKDIVSFIHDDELSSLKVEQRDRDVIKQLCLIVVAESAAEFLKLTECQSTSQELWIFSQYN